ncbi:MAG: DNA mismatch repair endonuclease MutL [Pseudanabaenaceae cyanobacterium]
MKRSPTELPLTRLQPLPIPLRQAIAAGETIDSLAAAVRELAENALDAGASRIDIEVECGDHLHLRVRDDGMGMTPADLAIAAQPYTTSKIAQLSDLQNVRTLGFRGAALFGLACLGDLSICSRMATGDGYQGIYDRQGNLQGELRPQGMAPGTIVQVRNLFAAVPQRQAALPSAAQQMRQLQQTVYRVAIAHPAITWQVHWNRRLWFALWPGQHPADLLPQMLRNTPPAALARLHLPWLDLVVGRPDRLSRPRPDWLLVAINGRVVQCPELTETLQQTLAKTVPRHRYPVCVAHLRVPPATVDWNRRAAKDAVYLQEVSQWQQRLADAIAQALAGPTSTPARWLRLAEATAAYTTQAPSPTPGIRAIAQVRNTYILAEHPGGIWLVEQHVADERAIFEDLVGSGSIVPLDPPLVLEGLDTEGAMTLQQGGMELEPFGPQTYLVRSLPQVLVNHPDRMEILRELSQTEDVLALQATLACRCAVRNGTPLALPALQNLLDRWQRCRNRHTCPHGRPICLNLEDSTLARFFRRNWQIQNNSSISPKFEMEENSLPEAP